MSVKVLEKRMLQGIEDGDFYVAEQACRTLYHRLTRDSRDGRSASAEDVERAFEIVMEGACKLLAQKQFQAGSALALLALKHLGDRAVPVSNSNTLDRVQSLCSTSYDGVKELPADSALEARKEQLRVVKSALKWTSLSSCGGRHHGLPNLNAIAGRVAESLGDYEASQGFFVRSDAPNEFALMLDKWASSSCIPSERGLFLARAVLMYLAAENLSDAETLRKSYVKLAGWPASGRPAEANPTPPLANFCDILVKSCQIGPQGSKLFARIQTVYGPALAADPVLNTLMQSVGQIYFSIQPPQPTGMAGMMQSMLRGMMASGGS